MITPQLLDYIKGQMQKGATPDMIKTALTKAGWPPNDVSEALSVATAPMVSMPPTTTPASPASAATPTTPAKNIDIQPAAASQSQGESMSISFSEPDLQSIDLGSVPSEPTKASTFLSGVSSASSMNIKKVLPFIMVGVLILGSVGAAVYFYTKIGESDAQAQTLTAQVATLQAQLNTLNAQNQELNTKVASLGAENASLDSQLSLFASPAIVGTSTQDVAMAVTGMLGNSNGSYTLTTNKNIIFVVKNSKDAGVEATLRPLLGSEVELSGTHAPASRQVTVDKVNGNVITTPPPANTATTTSVTTTPGQSTTTKPQ